MAKADVHKMLSGHVEIDETYVGGRRSGGKRGRGAEGKTIVLGMKERGGLMQTEVVPNVRKKTLRPVVNERVEKGSTVSTDELMSYDLLRGDGYLHGQVKHSEKDWAHYDWRVDAVVSTNGVERLLAPVQELRAVNAHPHLAEAHAEVPARIHFPAEPPGSREPDARRDFGGDVMTLARASSRAAASVGPIPSASACAANSSILLDSIASLNVSRLFIH